MTDYTTARSGFLRIEQGELEYTFWPAPDGAPRGPVLVLLHEGLGCVGMWRDFPDRLSTATGCAVFA